MDDFSCLGIQGRQFPQDLVGKFKGRLVIVSGGRCVWDDLARLGVRGGADGTDVMCVNDIAMHFPGRVQHLYSNDHLMIPAWIAARRATITMTHGPITHLHTCRAGAGNLMRAWPWPGNGTSSLSAVYTGLAMGYDPIILCGVPLDDSGHYFDPPWVASNFKSEVAVTETGQMAYWQNARDRIFRGRVKSMSGRTRDLLGAP